MNITPVRNTNFQGRIRTQGFKVKTKPLYFGPQGYYEIDARDIKGIRLVDGRIQVNTNDKKYTDCSKENKVTYEEFLALYNAAMISREDVVIERPDICFEIEESFIKK